MADIDIKVTDKNGVKLLTNGKIMRGDINVTLDESILPSGTLDITENGTYDVTNYESANVNVEGEKVYIKSKSKSFIPNTGVLTNIQLDLTLTKEQIYAILDSIEEENWTLLEAQTYFYFVAYGKITNDESELGLIIAKQEGGYVILTSTLEQLYDGNNWNYDILNKVATIFENYTIDLRDNINGASVGLANDKIVDLIFTYKPIELKGEYDGSDIEIDIPHKLEKIPNDNTIINEIYFNYNLNIEDIKKIIDSANLSWIKLNDVNVYPILFDSNTYYAYAIDEKYNIFIWNFATNTLVLEIFTNDTSWSNYIKEKKYEIKFETPITTLNEFQGISIGANNEEIKEIVSLKPYYVYNSTLDIKSMIENANKIPLEIVVNVESSGGERDRLKSLLDYTKSSAHLFYGNTIITDLTEYLEYNDTENVINMNNMFNGCSNLKTIPQLKSDNATDMSGMFNGCSKLTEISLSNTSKVTNMNMMFYGCSSLTTMPQLDTSNVTDISSMFNNCSKLTEISLSNTSKVTNMSMAFSNCSNLTNVKLSNTSKVTNMSNMFSNDRLLTKIDISYYNISSTSYSRNTFSYCAELKALIIRGFGNTTLNSNAIYNCYHLTGTTNSTYNPNGDKDGYIYVPRDMVDTLKSATNWSVYADQLRALEDYTIDGTTSGELDETKI